MDEQRAWELLKVERARVEELLAERTSEEAANRAAASEIGDFGDVAQTLSAEELDDAVAAALRQRLAALDQAEHRLAEGTYGRSVRSGKPIPDARLEADPAAEVTVEEAQGERTS